MTPLDPAIRALARDLLEDAEGPRGAQALSAAAAEEVLRKLRERLIKLIGARGFEALLRRGLRIARAEAPLLALVEVTPKGELTGLAQALAGRSAGEAAEATACLLARFLELLSTFIGAELTSRLVARMQRVDGGSGRDTEET